jgi:hypothetical protein
MADPKKPEQASIPDVVTSEKSPAEMAMEIARLTQALKKAESTNEELSKFSNILGSTSTESFDGQEEYDGEMRDTWRYKIDLPSSGGSDVSVNGHKFYHGQTYKVSTDTLRTLKDAVSRAWVHEASITGSNENFYRRPLEKRIGSRA